MRQQPRQAARNAGDDNRPASKQIDVAGELARAVGDDMAVVVGRIDDLD
jgi:hypothetical protein